MVECTAMQVLRVGKYVQIQRTGLVQAGWRQGRGHLVAIAILHRLGYRVAASWWM